MLISNLKRIYININQYTCNGKFISSCRLKPLQFAFQNVGNLGPATDYYKKMALDCSAQQIAVDLFMLNGQYGDLATVCKYGYCL